MALTICRECGAEISTRASRCPNCGYKSQWTGCSGCFLIFLIFFVAFLVLGAIGSFLRRNENPAAINQNFPSPIAALWTPAADPVAAGLDETSYWTGYREGHESAHIPLDQREAMHRICDEIIKANRLDRESFDQGFIAGTHDADIGLDRRKKK